MKVVLKKETSSLIIAALNSIRFNYIKARIDNAQGNSHCKLDGVRDETINHIVLRPEFHWVCESLECPRFDKRKKKGELWGGNFSERRLTVNYSGISGKHSQNQHKTI